MEVTQFLKCIGFSYINCRLFVISFYQMTLLHVAAEGGKLNIVEYLVGKWANVNTKNQFGVSVL